MSNSEIDATIAKLEKRITKPVYSSEISKDIKTKSASTKSLDSLARSIRHIIKNSQDDAQPQHNS